MSRTALLLTGPDGRIIEHLLPEECGLRVHLGSSCADVVGATAVNGRRICRRGCSVVLEGRVDHGTTQTRDGPYRLICAALPTHRIISLEPVPEAVLDERPLTAREREVLALISQGMTNKQIGEVLDLRPGTVRTHVEHVLVKLGVKTRAAAAARAVRTGRDED